jgi:hypothetical protein
MLGDMARSQFQETGELIIEPRCTVAEICDLLSDLGMILGDDAKLVEAQTMFGVGLCLKATAR